MCSNSYLVWFIEQARPGCLRSSETDFYQRKPAGSAPAGCSQKNSQMNGVFRQKFRGFCEQARAKHPVPQPSRASSSLRYAAPVGDSGRSGRAFDRLACLSPWRSAFRFNAFADEFALKFGDRAQHSEHHLAHRRRGADLLVQGNEVNAQCPE